MLRGMEIRRAPPSPPQGWRGGGLIGGAVLALPLPALSHADEGPGVPARPRCALPAGLAGANFPRVVPPSPPAPFVSPHPLEPDGLPATRPPRFPC